MIGEGRHDGRWFDGIDSRLLRWRAFAADRFVPLVVVMVIVTATGGWLVATTYLDPGTHVEERTTLAFERSAAFDHHATVRGPNPIYAEGAVLEDRPVYFTAITPVLDGQFVYRYSTPHDRPITATPELQLVLRSVDRGSDAETEFWRLSRPIEAGAPVQVRSGQTVTVPFTVNVSDLERQRARIEDDLGVVPGTVEAVVVARVHERGRIDGRRVATSTTRRLRLDLRGDTYAVREVGETESAVRWTEEVTVPTEHGPVREVGSVLLLIGGGLGIVGLVGAGLTGWLDIMPNQRRRLEFTRARDEHDAWVTVGRLPDGATEGPVVEVAAFEELINVAIHTDSRVIEDREAGEYHVVTDRLAYAYRPRFIDRK